MGIDQGIFDSGCSRHLTGNKSFLTDYQEIDGGFVAFGGSPKVGKITRKGKIRTRKLDFKDVYFVKELKFNLFSISQMCDKKNSVLFTEIECLVLSPNFKLLDESQVLLKVPRQNNMYNFDLKNVVPSGGLTCLFAKATIDESNLWHKRLGHINIKTMNKLVRGNLVRGLPSKLFENIILIACLKGMQHEHLVKTACALYCQPLQMLHMDLFGLTSVRSINHKIYCLVVTDDFSRFSWVFFLATKDETSGILKTFITGIENQINHKVKIIRCDNGTEFKNNDMNQFCGMKRIKREFSVARTSQQNRVAKRKNRTLIKAARTTLADYKAFRVFNTRTRKVKENLKITFLENKPNVAGSGPDWLFDIDLLTNSMNYEPVTAGNQTNRNAGIKDNVDAVPTQQYILLPLLYDSPQSSEDAIANDAGKKTNEEPANEGERNGQEKEGGASNKEDDQNVQDFRVELDNLHDTDDLLNTGIFNGAYDDEDEGAEADLNNLKTTMNKPKKVIQTLDDPIWIEVMQEELLQFKLQKVWTLVDLPNGKRAIGTKWVFRNKKDERGIVVRNNARLVAQGYTQEEGIDYDEVEKALCGLHQAPNAWYETLSTYLLENEVRRGTIDKTLFIKKDKDDEQEIPDKFYGGAYFLLRVTRKDISQKSKKPSKSDKTGHGMEKCIETNVNAVQTRQDKASNHEYILLPFLTSDSQGSKSSDDKTERLVGQGEATITNSSNRLNTVSPSVSAAGQSFYNNDLLTDPLMPDLEDSTGIFIGAYDDEDVGEEADLNNLETIINVSPIPTTRIHKDHPKDQIIGDINSAIQTWRMINFFEENAMVIQALIDPSWIEAMQEELLQFKLQKVWTLVDLPKGKRVIRTKIEAIRLVLAYASFMGFIMYQMDVKSSFLYSTIEEEVYVCQPPSFKDPQFSDNVYKVEKAIYGLHQAPRAWYETLSTYLLENGYRRGTIDKTLFIKKDRGDILLVQVYVDDIIFGSTKKSLCVEFEQMMHKRFQMSSMGELTFFLGLQVMQKDDGIFISQDKYVADILKKFDFVTVKTASTPIETNKALLKDEEAKDVDVHLYRSMIGSLMYLTASRPDIMFAVCACARYLKGQPKLGLWYPMDSPFDLEAFSDSDYAGASLDRKSTTGGCQFLGKRLISWQCKKQTIVANSTTEAEYVAAANCCGQVLWIQNQMLDYGFNFMNTKIHIDNESTICIMKNLVFHSKTKHIEIRHHFIRDSYKKKLIQVIKIHTDHNVADLLTKAFDVSRKAKRTTEISQSSGPIHLVADETVYKEWEDRMERAATTASRLEAEQDNGNINRTQSMATLNESVP
ncbi:putative ribonuclease H-like domain-containing protein [Tanacetum coccineum]